MKLLRAINKYLENSTKTTYSRRKQANRPRIDYAQLEERKLFAGLNDAEYLGDFNTSDLMNSPISISRIVSHPRDAFIFKFSATFEQTVIFDVNTPTGVQQLRSYIRIMDSEGNELAEDFSGSFPTTDPLIEYEFPASGQYFVMVTSHLNSSYQPKDGSGGFTGNFFDPNDTGPFTLFIKEFDTDDQIGESNEGFESSPNRGYVSSPRDVDVFEYYNSAAGNVWMFDLDRAYPTPSADLRLAIYSDNGQLLYKTLGYHGNNGPAVSSGFDYAPRESTEPLLYPYLEYRFEEATLFYVVVSVATNTNFNIIDGSLDSNSDSTSGFYELQSYELVDGFGNDPDRGYFGLVVRFPNFNPYNGEKEFIGVNVGSIDENGNYYVPIRSNVDTWMVTHGRSDSGYADETSLTVMGLAKFFRKQSLFLDWGMGADDNLTLQLEGARWIPYVAKAIDSLMEVTLNITGNKLSLVGHSWGTYLCYEIAKQVDGKQSAIVALDPATYGIGYNRNQVNFQQVANYSWAIYGDGLYGSHKLSITARDSFILRYQYPSVSNEDRHSLPRQIFIEIGKSNLGMRSDKLKSVFNLNSLTSGSSIFDQNQNRFGKYEARFIIGGTPNGPQSYVGYEYRVGGQFVRVLDPS